MQWTTKSSLPQVLLDVGEDRVDGGGVGDVAMAGDMGADAFGERAHALFQRFALIGEGELGARVMGGLGDAPGDGSVVGDAHNQAALACQNARRARLRL